MGLAAPAGRPLPPLTLVLGATGSGKSRWAEQLALASDLAVTYIATGPQRPEDSAWQQRLQRHRQRRPGHWRCLELAEPQQIPAALAALEVGELALVDALGTWVASALELEESGWQRLSQELLAVLPPVTGHVILVSDQVGWGVVPATAIGGRFRDRLTRLERQLVTLSQRSWLVVAGRALDLQALGEAVPED